VALGERGRAFKPNTLLKFLCGEEKLPKGGKKTIVYKKKNRLTNGSAKFSHTRGSKGNDQQEDWRSKIDGVLFAWEPEKRKKKEGFHVKGNGSGWVA